MGFLRRYRVLESLVHAFGDALIVFDPHGTVLYRNEAAAKLEQEYGRDALYLAIFKGVGTARQETARATKVGGKAVSTSSRTLVDDGSLQIERLNGSRTDFFMRVREFRSRADWFFSVSLRDFPSSRRLLTERNRALVDLENSHAASLNYMEDLVRQKDELEDALHNLADEVSRRQLSEAARERLASIVESTDEAIFSCNLQGAVTSWNKAAELLFSYTKQEMIGADSLVLVPEDQHDGLRTLQQKILDGEKVQSFECVRLTRSGARLHVSTTWSPLLDIRGRLSGYSIICRDISDRIATERELEEYRGRLERLVEERTAQLVATQEQVRQSERLASIGALAAGIAHEINNPIGAMLLAAQNALEELGEGSSLEELKSGVQRLCRKVISNTHRCGSIVRGVLQFARKQRGERSPQDINTIVKTSIQLVRESMSLESAELSLQLYSKPLILSVNPVEIEQVVVNLVKNACQSAQGKVAVVVRTEGEKDRVRIVVEDNGRGIAEEDRVHIFDPFFTTRQNRGGTGLGLSIVHGIVTGYGGAIDVSSAVGVGTSISVTLPEQHNSGNAPIPGPTVA